MSLATDVWHELKKIREHKAFYAAAGAGDVAMEALRGLPERLGRLQDKADLAALSGRAVEYVIVFGARAVQTYDELAERGREVVGGAEWHQAGTELEPRPSGTVAVAGGETATVSQSMEPGNQAGPVPGQPGSAGGTPGSGPAAGKSAAAASRSGAATGRAGSAGSAAPGSRTSQTGTAGTAGTAGSAGSAARQTGSATSQGTAKPGRSRGKSTD